MRLKFLLIILFFKSFPYAQTGNNPDSLIKIADIYREKAVDGFNALHSREAELLLTPGNRSLSLSNVALNLDSAKSLVQKALDRIRKNYPQKRHVMECFYRKVSTENSQYTNLIEASVVIEDNGYSTDVRDNLKVKLLQLRQSNELGNIDSVAIKYAWESGKVVPNPYGKNSIYRTYEYNLVRLYSNPYSLFNGMGGLVSYSDLKIKDRSISGKDTIYHITIGDRNTSDTSNYLKVNGSDLAIVEFKRTVYFDQELVDQVEAKFRKINGHYYPEVIRTVVPRIINQNSADEQLDIHTLWIDRVETTDLRAVKGKDVMDKMQPLNILRLPYDELFWDNYKMLKIYPLAENIRYSLEIKGNLVNQFKENAGE